MTAEPGYWRACTERCACHHRPKRPIDRSHAVTGASLADGARRPARRDRAAGRVLWTGTGSRVRWNARCRRAPAARSRSMATSMSTWAASPPSARTRCASAMRRGRRSRRWPAPTALELDIESWPLSSSAQARIPEIRLRPSRDVLPGNAAPRAKATGYSANPAATTPQFAAHLDRRRPPALPRRARQKTDIDIAVNSAQPQARGRRAADRHRRRRPTGAATASPCPAAPSRRSSCSNTEKPYRINLHASAGATTCACARHLIDPFQLRDFDLQLALSGKNLEDLYPLIGVATPADAAVRARRTLDAATATTWHYDDFTGKVGDSDLGGSARVTTGGASARCCEADLVSKRLDFDDLAGFVGARAAGRRQRSRPIPNCKAQAAQAGGEPARAARHALRTRQAARDGCRRAAQGAPHQCAVSCRSTTWTRT